MRWHNVLWRWLTESNALKEISALYEAQFFEFMYRIIYIAGISQSDHGVLYKLYGYFWKLMYVLYLSSQFWYLCTMSTGLDEVVANISTFIVNLIAVYRHYIWVNYKDIYKKLTLSMESPYFDVSTQTRENIILFWARKNYKYFLLLLGLALSSIICWPLAPLIDDVEYNLAVTCRLPYNYETPLRYAFTYVVVHLAFIYSINFVVVNDLIMQTHLLHLLCQWEILADCFKNIIDDCSVDFVGLSDQALFSKESFQRKYKDQLYKCEKQHQFLLNLAQDLRRMLSAPMLLQFASSGTLIIFTGYQVTANVTKEIPKLIMWTLYLMYNLFMLFLLCLWCDQIKTKVLQSEAIGEAVYASGWERRPVAARVLRPHLRLVAARAARPALLTAGGIYDLSLSSYASLVKTSYSVLTVMLRHRNSDLIGGEN